MAAKMFNLKSRMNDSRRQARDDEETLEYVNEIIRMHEESVYHIHARMYECILFVHGLQHLYYSVQQNRAVAYPNITPKRVRVVYNITLPIVEAQKSMFLAAKPERRTFPIGEDDMAINAARYGSDVCEFGEQEHNVDEMTIQLGEWLAECGNVFVETSWDPHAGRRFSYNGKVFHEGGPIMRVRPPFQIGMHPHASSLDESPYCTSDTWVAREEGIAVYGRDKIDSIADYADDGTFGPFFERNLTNLSLDHGAMSAPMYSRAVRPFFRRFELYVLPCEKYPNGRIIVCGGGGSRAEVILEQKDNPYDDHPFTHFRMITVPGRSWAESLVPTLMPMQREFNRRRGQLIEMANRMTNNALLVPKSVAQSMITNAPLAIIPYPDNATTLPQYLQLPPIPDILMEAETTALNIINQIAQPVGLGYDEAVTKATSGVQLSLLEEIKQRKIAPVIRRWEIAWDSVWRKYLSMWSKFQRAPRTLGVHREDGSYRQFDFKGAMIEGRVAVRVTPFSALQRSRTATFAEWIELTKAGAANPALNPEDKAEMYADLGKGHLVKTHRMKKAQFEKAERILTYIRQGNLEEVQPDLVDDPRIFIAVFQEWILSEEYATWRKKNPEPDRVLRTLLNFYSMALADMQRQAAAAAGMQAADAQQPREQGSRGPEGVAASAKTRRAGNPQGGSEPKATQGFGTAPNPRSGQGQPSPDGRE